MYTNKHFTLSLHKECFGGIAQDFIIRFKKRETSIEEILLISSDIVRQLIDRYLQRGKTIKGRLVARVCYHSLASGNSVEYYHPSYQSELIADAKEFYTRHMMKIADRMDNFNREGSSLLINNIVEVHLHVSTLN